MRLEGRLTGHFLARVVLLVAGLGLVFFLWLGGLAFSALVHTRQEATAPPITILRTAADITHAEGDAITLDPQTTAALAEGGYWLQVLDENGDELAQYQRPDEVPTHYTPGGLVLYRSQPGDIGQQKLSTWVETVDGRELTFVLGASRPETGGPSVYLGGDEPVTQPTLWVLMVALVVGGAAVTIGVAWFTGRGLARPLVHMMRWLSALAAGDYREPPGKGGMPLSRGFDGRRRRPYATYREVFDSLDSLTTELRHTAEERERLEKAREEWIAGVTHDLRTPLTSIQGYANVLASEYEFDTGEVRRQSAVIATQAGHMDSLLDDLNLSFRLRSTALPLEMTSVDAIELVREAAVALVNDPRSEGREVVFEEPPGTGPITMQGDPLMLRRVLTNLLVNAAVHNPAGTTIALSVTREMEHVSITVADDGVGMSAEVQRNLFDRYYRGTSTQQGAEGTGLGMAIARQIVQAHRGDIAIRSEPSRGTIVTVQLPVSR